jgi:hypothetical protein
MLLRARGALHPREAATEQAAVEVAVELTAHERRQRRSLETRGDGGIERLDVVADDRVQRGRLGAMPLVGAGMPAVERNRGESHGARMERAVCRIRGPRIG